MALSAQVLALYMSYPMDPATSYPNGALGVTAAEMTRLRTGEFRGYIWVRWFSTTMLLIWPVFALRLAGTGFEESGGREYLLSLPATRRRIAISRLTVSAAQMVALAVVPSLLVCAMAPLQGQRYPVADALVHSAILIVGGLGLFGLTMFLRVIDQGCRRVCGDGRPDRPGRDVHVSREGIHAVQRLPGDERRRLLLQSPRAVDRPGHERHRSAALSSRCRFESSSDAISREPRPHRQQVSGGQRGIVEAIKSFARRNRSSASLDSKEGTVMNKHVLLGLAWSLSVAVGAGVAATRQSSAGAAGHWEGAIETPGQKLDIMVDLARSGEWDVDGTITIPSTEREGVRAVVDERQGQRRTFGMKGIPGDPMFKGTVSANPRTIAGDFSQGGAR